MLRFQGGGFLVDLGKVRYRVYASLGFRGFGFRGEGVEGLGF